VALFLGTQFNDNLVGNENEDDVLIGYEGDDFLDGRSGADRMEGGSGNDTYVVDDEGDLIVELAGEGIDSVNTIRNSYTLGANLEFLIYFGNSNFTGTGNTLDNFIQGRQGNDTLFGMGGADSLFGLAGDDYLDGGDGDDLLVGGEGADTMVGGAGNDTYIVADIGDIVVEVADNGRDLVQTTLSSYTLGANVEDLTFIGAGPSTLRGNAANNVITGGSGNDFIYLTDGGVDTVFGGAGNDAFLFGATLTAADQVNGGAGADVLAIQGNYNLVLGAGNLVEVETLSPLSGSDTRFGDSGTNLYSYSITTVDANVAAGGRLTINAAQLLAGENLTVNGSAETDGTFFIYGGKGGDTLTGGSGADVFFFGVERFAAGDRINGGAGADVVVLRGDYNVVFNADTFTNIETVTLMSATDTRFASGGLAYNYNVTTHDANVAAGATFTFNGGALRSDETVVFNGSAETNGNFRLFGGSGADVLRGGAGDDLIRSNAGNDQLFGGGGNDILRGGLGADRIEGGAGNDIYDYTAAAESTGTSYDTLVGFNFAADKINLPGVVTGWSGHVTQGSLSSGSFDTDLAAALNAQLQASNAILFTASQGSLAGKTFLVVDADGDGNYQAGADFVFELIDFSGPLPSAPDLFI
jgi:Ca2+-binding RTX toxin-like protein